MQLRDLVRRRWLWPVPAVLVHAVALATSRRVWTETVVSYSRTGAASVHTVGARDLYLVGALLGLFFGVGLLRLFAGGGSSRAGLAVDDAQVGCVLATVRVASLFLLYLSAAMLLRHSLGLEAEAAAIERAVEAAIDAGARTRDLGGALSTEAMGDAVRARL